MTTLPAPTEAVYQSSHAGATARWGAVRALRPGRGPLLAVAALVTLHVLALSQQITPLRAVLGLPIAVVLPGALALRIIGGRPRRGWDWMVHAVALSLLGLSVVGLVVALLPGGALTTVGSLLGLDVLLAVLAVGAARTARKRGDRPTAGPLDWKRLMVPSPLGLLAITLGTAAVGLAVAGAQLLNTGGKPAGVMLAIAVAAAALVAATMAAGARGSTAAATTIYLVALSVLLATSLRGTGVTGHDIKIEYRVFTDTLESGSWRPGGLFPGYNSCLSITVLPTFLARLLGIPALDVFRVCFQMLFAVVPVGVYLGARRLLPAPYAVLAAVLMVAFPTFVNDMPMLNRQEIALIFFTVLVLNLTESARPRRQQLVMFAAAATGLAVSHYTSTDVAAQLLLMAWCMRRILQVVRRRRAHPAPLRPVRAPALGLPTVVLVVLAVGWPLVAGSAAAFGETLKNSVASVAAGASAASTSTSYSFFSSAPQRTDAEVLDAHLAEVRQSRGLPAAVAPACPTTPVPTEELPRTPVGSAVAAVGLSPNTLNGALRSAAVVLFQGGAIAGVVLLIRCGRHTYLRGRAAVPVLAEFGGGGIAVLAATVAVPQLADAYGLLRLFQQLLIVLAPVVIMALATGVHIATRRFLHPSRWYAGVQAGTALVVIGCALATSGFIPRLTGEYPPQLNLANAGPYFETYYASAADVRAVTWIGTHLPPRTTVSADSRDAVNLLSFTRITPVETVAPGTVPPDTYLVVRTDDGVHADAVAIIGEQAIRYTFPLSCVVGERPLIHRSGRHLVYGPAVPL